MVERLTRDTLDDDLSDDNIGFNDENQDEYAFDDGEEDYFEEEAGDFEEAGFPEEGGLDDDEMAAARAKAQKQFKTAMMAVGGFAALLIIGGGVFLFSGSSGPQTQGSNRPLAAAQPPVQPVQPIETLPAAAPVQTAQVAAPTPTQVDTAFGADLYEFDDVSTPSLTSAATTTEAPALPQAAVAAVTSDIMPQIEELEAQLAEQSTVMAAQDQQIAQQRSQINAMGQQLAHISGVLEVMARQEAAKAAQPSPVTALEEKIGQQQNRIAQLERSVETNRRAEIAVNLTKPRLSQPSRPSAVRNASFTPARTQVAQGSGPVVFRGAQPNQVWLSPQNAPDDLQSYRIGDVVPGLGRLTRIGLSTNNRWYIETEGGRVTEFSQ